MLAMVGVGSVPLLQRVGPIGAWSVRPVAELNDELSTHYRLPIDITAKANALSLIVHALNRGDLAMAAIASVQMQLPDAPAGLESEERRGHRAMELRRSRLLKVWEPDEHPRAGVPPNPGWFASVSGQPEPPVQVAMAPRERWEPGEGVGGGADEDLFGGELPQFLARFVPGAKTYGIFESGKGKEFLQSGYEGPAKSIPRGTAGFNSYLRSHVEGHPAALMRQEGIMNATLRINNPKICANCTELLPRVLPEGSTLRVQLHDGTVKEFKGISR